MMYGFKVEIANSLKKASLIHTTKLVQFLLAPILICPHGLIARGL